jgi:hypothetical protein
MKYILLLLLCSCNNFEPITGYDFNNQDNLIVKAQVSMLINTNKINTIIKSATNSSVPVSVTVSSNVQFTIDSSGFSVPANTAVDTLNFGNIKITSLRDNNIKVCGNNHNVQCTQAVLRTYTTGSGAGLWNSTDSYGAPLSAIFNNITSLVGLNVANAAVMQTYTIPNNKHVVNLSDFIAPDYNFTANFSNAGVGSYSTIILIEYGLL